MRKNLHHAIPGLRGVADRALDRKLLVKDLIDQKPHFATANAHLRVFSQGPGRFDTATHGVRMTSAFKGKVEAPSVRVLLDGITYASFFEIAHVRGPEATCGFKTQVVSVNADNDGIDSFGDQQFQTQQSNRPRTRYQHHVANPGTG